MDTLQSKKQINKLIILFTLVYMVSYITRINYATIILEMEKSTKIARSLLSMALTGSFVTYGIGQVISGFLGDKFSAKRLISCGFLITALMNFAIPLCQNPYVMLCVWCVNGFAQSLMWPPLVKLMTMLFSDEDYKRASVRVSWGSSFGTIFVYLVSPVIISVSGWRSVFVISAIFALIMLFVWNKWSFNVKSEAKESVSDKGSKSLSVVFAPVMIFVMIAIILQGMLRDGVTTWMPTYISDTYNLSSVISILTGVILPIFSIISFQLASNLYRKVFKNPLMCAGVIFALGFAAAAVLYMLSDYNAAMSVFLSAVLTGAMHGVNLILICMIPAFFKKYGNVSTVSGIVNSCTYIGSAISTYGIAFLSQKLGWNFTLFVWMLIALLGTIICILNVKVWNRKFGRGDTVDISYKFVEGDGYPAILTVNNYSTPIWNQAQWSSGEYKQYVRKNGCGHCCTAMALKLNGIEMDPHTEFELCRKMWGEPRTGEPFNEGNFISATGIEIILKSFGVPARAYGVDKGKTMDAALHIREELLNNKLVIFWSHPSKKLEPNPFSSGEHYVMAVGVMPGGEILIANSSTKGSTKNGIQFTDVETLAKALPEDRTVADYTWGRYDFSRAGVYVVVG